MSDTSKVWPRVSPQDPCPICGKPDWCQFGDRAVKCMRVESAHVCVSGGWYHFYSDKEIKYLSPKAKPAPPNKPKIDCFALLNRWRVSTSEARLMIFSKQLGVTASALKLLGAYWSQEHNAWAFAMKNAAGNTIGIRLRNLRGFKWAVEGSLQGIFVPENKDFKYAEILGAKSSVLLPEGPTDVAAALSIGLYAIGRPTCQTGNDLVRDCLKRLRIYKAVIVADNDELKKRPNGSQWRPGIDGALKLKKELGLASVIWTPPSPIKDLREFVIKGGTAEMILSDVKNKIWTRK